MELREQETVIWHAELEELTVRIDARPEDKDKLKNTDLVGKEVNKVKGSVLKLVQGNEGILST